jgi:hypothetical protein
LGRRWNIDPEIKGSPWNSSYSTFNNNPISNIDPNGRFSTHTDSAGKVLAVYNDNDLGIYKHDNMTTEAQVNAAHSKDNTSAGGKKMGETLLWNSFQDDDQHNRGTINFGSYDGFVWMAHVTVDLKNLKSSDIITRLMYAMNAGNVDYFDYNTFGRGDKKGEDLINYQYRGSQISPGVYLSASDFGNYYAGFAARLTGQNQTDFLKTAGAFNHYGNNKFKLVLDQIFSYYENHGQKPPLYGEDMRSNYFQRLGWQRIINAEGIAHMSQLDNK